MQATVELPNELKYLLGIIVTMVVTEILKRLGQKMSVDLSGYAAQVTAALVGSVLVLVNAAFSNVPAEFVPIVNSLFGLIVVVLGSFGAYKVLLAPKK